MRPAIDLWARPRNSLTTELDRWFDEWLSSDAWAVPERPKASFRPACDFEETPSHYLLSFDVPGMRKEDFSIHTSGDTLMVEGERKQESKRAEENRFYSERSYGRFTRQFQFPVAVDADKIEAEYENGVLRIALAKEKSSQPRKVEIKGESAKPGLFEKFIGKPAKATS